MCNLSWTRRVVVSSPLVLAPSLSGVRGQRPEQLPSQVCERHRADSVYNINAVVDSLRGVFSNICIAKTLKTSFYPDLIESNLFISVVDSITLFWNITSI